MKRNAMKNHNILSGGMFDFLFWFVGCSAQPVVWFRPMRCSMQPKVRFWSVILVYIKILHWFVGYEGNLILAGVHSIGSVQHFG